MMGWSRAGGLLRDRLEERYLDYLLRANLSTWLSGCTGEASKVVGRGEVGTAVLCQSLTEASQSFSRRF